MSTSTSSVEIQELIYEDPDALLPDDTHEDHPEVKAKPVPAPRFKLYQQTQHNSTSNNAKSSYANGSITTAATSSGYPPGYKRLQPARPAPSLPVKTEKRTNVIEESSRTSNAQPRVRPPDIHIKQPPPPPPPPRPARFPGSPKYSDKLPTSASQRYENTSAHPGPSSPSSASYTYLTPVSPARSQESLNVTGTNYGTQPPDIHIKQPPPPPPWPARFPGSPIYSDKLPTSASQRYENTSAHPGPSRPSSASYTYLTPVSPARSQESLNVTGTNYGTQNTSAHPGPSRPSSASYTYLTPVSPARSQESLNVTGTNYGTQNSPPPLPLNPPPQQSSRRSSTHSEIDNLYLEILPDDPDETDLNELLNWFNRTLTHSGSMPLSLYGLSKDDQMSSISQKAMNAKNAWHLYNLLMMRRKEDLQKIITEFRSICEHLNKMKKKQKTMGIAGGTTGAVGGVATVVGIILAPVTFGTSLIATAVGAGMIASAGGMGAHAAMANKKTVTRAAVEKLVNDYKEGVTDLERCLYFILSTAMELQKHGIARLEGSGAHPDAVRTAYKLHNVLSSMDIYEGAHARSGGMTSEKLLQALTKEMDLFFTEKNGQKLKKSNKSIFSGKVSLLADGLKERLDHLTEMWEKLS